MVYPDYDYPEGFYNEIFDKIKPPNAYHKHDCVVVLGRGDEAIRELSDWVDDLRKLNVVVDTYSTGAEGLQAIISRTTGKAFRIKE